MKVEQGAFEYSPSIQKLGTIKHSKNRQVIGIEIIKDHIFGDKDFITIEIVFFRCYTSKQTQPNKHHELHKTKIVTSIERGI